MRVEKLERPIATKDFLLARWPDCRLFTIPFILGVRGYYIIEGKSGENRRGLYDDAIFLFGDKFSSFNANTDPSDSKLGRAVLQTGTYQYQIGLHNRNAQPPRQHIALVQSAKVKIRRDGEPFAQDGFYGINIHRGGRLQTGSEGCQTIPSDQWDEFIKQVRLTMDNHQMKFIYYKLVEVSHVSEVRV